MAATQYGTKLALGAIIGTPTVDVSAYWVESDTEGGIEADKEMIPDGADGSLETIIVYRRDAVVTFTMRCSSTATPTATFVPGTMLSTTWYVESAPVTKTKNPWVITVTLKNIGVS